MVSYTDMLGPPSSASLSRYSSLVTRDAALLPRGANLEPQAAEAGLPHSGITAQDRGRMCSWELRQCNAATARPCFGLLGPWHPWA